MAVAVVGSLMLNGTSRPGADGGSVASNPLAALLRLLPSSCLLGQTLPSRRLRVRLGIGLGVFRVSFFFANL